MRREGGVEGRRDQDIGRRLLEACVFFLEFFSRATVHSLWKLFAFGHCQVAERVMTQIRVAERVFVSFKFTSGMLIFPRIN